MEYDTIILRHRKENLKKCSLRGLETREGLCFLTYPIDSVDHIENVTLLSFDAPLLSEKDQGRPLFLIDSTWNYAAVMERALPSKGSWIKRSLPSYLRTAYPRKQTGCHYPERGLASIEALYMAHHILGRSKEDLLDYYRWKEEFLTINKL